LKPKGDLSNNLKINHFRKDITMKNIIFLSVFVLLLMAGCKPTVVDFDNLSSYTVSSPNPMPVKPGNSFKVGTTLIDTSSGVVILVLPFKWHNPPSHLPPPSPWTDEGFVEIVQGNKAGGSGNEIHFDNACLGIIAPDAKTIKNLSFKFGYYGGDVNLIANGTLCSSNNIASMPPTCLPKVGVSVSPHGNIGVIELSGEMDKFYFSFPVPPKFPVLQFSAVIGGGQELWIDDLEFSE